jgi:nucleoside-diphosphate-sugar epimerase
MIVMLTGANGFVGRAVLCQLVNSGYKVRPVVRSHLLKSPCQVLPQVIADFESDNDLSAAMDGVKQIIHLAARVHVMDDQPLHINYYRQVNVTGTLNLARQAARAGVCRFIFVSSVKVNGEVTLPGRAFRADDKPAPLDLYGFSKMEAERGLREIEAQTGMEVVVVRPPLVYGPGVKANFASMMRWVGRGIPLPLGSIHNSRSMVALDNLADFLVTCVGHPKAAGQNFLISDGEDVSTSELLRRTAMAMEKKILLLPVPSPLLTFSALLLGKRKVAKRLCSSLQVDIEKNRQLLGWTPSITLDEGLKKTVRSMKQ